MRRRSRAVPAPVLEDDPGAERIDREVDDDFDPFCHRESNAREDDWCGKQPLIGGNLKQRLMRAERQSHRRGVRGIQDTKAVLSRRDLENGPWGAVHQDDAAVAPWCP